MFSSKNFEDLYTLLFWLDANFDITAVTESRIKNNLVCSKDFALPNYSVEETPTEASAGGALLCINQRLVLLTNN